MSRHPVETLWREVGLPEYFLGNGGTNIKLYDLYDRIRGAAQQELEPFAWRWQKPFGDVGEWQITKEKPTHAFRMLEPLYVGVAQQPIIPVTREAAEPTQYLIDQFREHGSKPSAQDAPDCGVERAALTKINEIRNSIIGTHTLNWSEHVYPLVAALGEAGFEGMSYPEARENYGTLVERAVKAEDALKEIRKYCDENLGPSRSSLLNKIAHLADTALAVSSTVLSTPEDREPDAWEWRACIGGRWGAWLYLDQPLARFQERNAFNLDNGTYELRALYASAGSK